MEAKAHTVEEEEVEEEVDELKRGTIRWLENKKRPRRSSSIPRSARDENLNE